MANKYLISDARINNLEEIKDMRDYINCGICLQVVTEERNPKECSNCHNQLFCEDCLTKWKRCNETLGIKLLPAHEYNCGYGNTYNSIVGLKLDKCKFCKESAPSRFSTNNELGESAEKEIDINKHLCDIKQRQWCLTHKRTGTFFTIDRIVNYEEYEQLFELFKCQLCEGLIRMPKSCNNCKYNFCTICISSKLMERDVCPACFELNPQFSEMSRNLCQIISKFKIKCKNSGMGCDQVFEYDKIIEHELQCGICQDCKSYCVKCQKSIDIGTNHECQIEERQEFSLLAQDNVFDSLIPNVPAQIEHQRPPQVVRQPPAIIPLTNQIILKCREIGTANPILIIVFIILDFLHQNFMLFAYIYYAITQDFINIPTQVSYCIATGIFYIVSQIPQIDQILHMRKTYGNYRLLSKFQKIGMIFSGFFNAIYVVFVFFINCDSLMTEFAQKMGDIYIARND
ncbi:traf-type zinc finger family protein [Stylonychia lemnae]|uniref:Traf-type zinc finger family protein n=1 Tax=Stylonychia lemnae TaxID=5949 RepID=A0A078BAS5_STYLE|nr:traf-type zinc finger family protein [Stylonychia lemnae]|eukprot:CDW91665.1 traf-type zinc finger family protein [Stylonychia lemnae]